MTGRQLSALAALGASALWAVRAFSRPSFSYRGKACLVTGGSRGLGLILARQLADAGADVAVCGRDRDELNRAAADLGGRGGGAVFAGVCDVTDRDQMRWLVGETRRRFGKIDVLINNAGIIDVGPLETQELADYERSLKTHFWAPLYACREVIPEMRDRRSGRIVNIASFGGKVSVPHLVPYSAGKFALVGLSDGLRTELIRHNVYVTTVNPGLMRTGSHIQARFKGRHEQEYAWFALGNAIPGMSISAERAARKILAAAARGDAELVLTLPAKAAVLARAVCPELLSDVSAAVNRWALPKPGGVGSTRVPGYASRGSLPDAVTAISDRAARRNNETVV